MRTRLSLWRLLDRLTSFMPGPPDKKPRPTVIPDPNEPGISDATRRARLRLWRHRYEKQGKGGYR